MQSLQQTLRRSKALTEKYNIYLKQRQQNKKKDQQTRDKLQKTIQMIQNTIQSVNKVTDRIDSFQQDFSNAINALAVSAIKQSNIIGTDTQPKKQTAKNGTLKDVTSLIQNSKKIMVLTGAGLSAASGLKTFRGQNGYWTQNKQQLDPKRILTNSYYVQNPQSCWNWLIQFHKAKLKVKPNDGHYYLEKLRRYCLKQGKHFDIVSQNIDNLHKQTEQELQVINKMKQITIKNKTKKMQVPKPIEQTKLFEIHGNITRLRCQQCTQKCGKLLTYPTNFLTAKLPYSPPPCSKCRNPLRPHIMMFDQSYNEPTNSTDTLKQIFQQCDLFIVIGTALQTGMAYSLVTEAIFKNIKIVQINIEKNIKYGDTYTINQKSQIFLKQLFMQINK